MAVRITWDKTGRFIYQFPMAVRHTLLGTDAADNCHLSVRYLSHVASPVRKTNDLQAVAARHYPDQCDYISMGTLKYWASIRSRWAISTGSTALRTLSDMLVNMGRACSGTGHFSGGNKSKRLENAVQ